jgi:very-short-patch-repair endonuclease
MSLILTPLAQNLRTNQTEAEKIVWSRLRNRQFMNLKFKRQVPIEGYVVDFLCQERGIIVELDGGQHEGSEADQMRTEILESSGFLVKRYWNNDVMKNIDGVLVDLQCALNTLTPTLSQGERGYKDEEDEC